MKAMSACAIALCLLFFACSKDDKPIEKPSPSGPKEKVAVTFSATGFTQETVDLANSRTTLAATAATDSMGRYVNYFWYLAYDNKGKEISRKFQKSSLGSNFGVVKDSLQPGGPYTIVMFASPFNLEFNGPDTIANGGYPYRNPAPLSLDSAFLSFRVVDWYWTKEAFYKKFTININNDTIVAARALDRIVGKVEVNILDANANQNITVRIDKECGYYFFNTGKTDAIHTDPEVPDIDNLQIIRPFKRVSPTKFELFVLNRTTPMVATITALDGNYKVMAERKVAFTNEWNKRVIITGKLFGPEIDPHFGFKVSLNTDWSSDSTQIGF
ncbi:hypothetical protein [Chitinophaga sp.]|uniref:hypothetical protein n=1 Tax=Chitinophaga sp. TaxID=1869181 RepID=UPI002F928331